MTGPISNVTAQFGGDGHFCTAQPAAPEIAPEPCPAPLVIIPVTAQFSGDSHLCSTLAATPAPAPPTACPVGVGVAPALTGAGTLAARVGPYSMTFFEVTGTFYAVADPSISGTINEPIMQTVSGLVTFTPRLPAGFQAFVGDYLVQEAFDAEQTISMIGNPIEGTWQLNFGGDITAVMQFNITPADLQTALEALPSVGVGDIDVIAGINPQSYQVNFLNTLGATYILPLVPTWNNLTDANGYDCEITVAVSATGGPLITADTAISIPPRKARIWSGVLSTIDYVDTPGTQLVANDPILAIPAEFQPLIYDVVYSAVTFNNASQMLANFAFEAPVDNTPVCITDPALHKLNYAKPDSTIFQPQKPNLTVVTNWRHRNTAVA
jgi:hypothetical protein